MQTVDVAPVSPERLAGVIGSERYKEFVSLAARMSEQFRDRTVWNVSSTATGGGVAEMLKMLVAYGLGAGIQTRWLVVDGDPQFFRTTKRLHNRLHGAAGDEGALGSSERDHYQSTLERNLPQLLEVIGPKDVVILHDPQTAGLAMALVNHGAGVIWRCHVGTDTTNDHTKQAWLFLRPFCEIANHLVFSRAQYVPDWVDPARLTIIAPAIDPFSVKNMEMEPDIVRAVLSRAGIIAAVDESVTPTFQRGDGTTGAVERCADVVRKGAPPAPDVPMVVQVSRWDELKDMKGVLEAFARGVAASADLEEVQLALVGPRVAGVTDDPEGQQVLEECTAVWRALPENVQRRISLISLPTEDFEENAAVVNAVQRHAAIVVQKSLMEGFGLTVAEAMWKSRPVVASAVGGILDQITPGEEGLLVQDPRDLEEFSGVLCRLLVDAQKAADMGLAARTRVVERFLPDRELTQWADVLSRVDAT
jgi:trehalose synthase